MEIGYLRKEDIQSPLLWMEFFYNNKSYFPERRFRFFVNCDPEVLMRSVYLNGELPIHAAARNSTLRGFQLVFEAGVRYFSKKKGITILFQYFQKTTPFKVACENHGREETTKAIERALADCSNNNPYDTADDALLLAAMDERIDLDGVYFILRREPDVLAKLLWRR